MTKRCHNAIRFSRSKRRHVEAEFTGAEVTGNGGAMLLAEADRRMGAGLGAAGGRHAGRGDGQPVDCSAVVRLDHPPWFRLHFT